MNYPAVFFFSFTIFYNRRFFWETYFSAGFRVLGMMAMDSELLRNTWRSLLYKVWSARQQH